jgi:FMN phosphatase YigB (HAD superfamily)
MIRLVVCDLDNTLYDWVAFFVPAFDAMVDELAGTTKIDPHELRQSFKRVHQEQGTSEYAFAIQQLDALDELNEGLSTRQILERYRPAVEAFRRERKARLRLYDGVLTTIANLRRRGIRVVAHTDAMMFYAAARIRQLCLENELDGLVAQQDHGLPPGLEAADVRQYDDDWYRPRLSYVEELPPELMKPNPDVLSEILTQMAVSSSEAVFVGDSLTRDISMAQSAGVHDVYAAYGVSHDSALYARLVEVTHWTDEDVARETQLKQLDVRPSWTIDSFPELLHVIEKVDAGAESRASGARA